MSARVRNVQVHGVTVDEAPAGQRTALALHGLAKADLARGDWVLAPGSLAPSTLISARIDLLPDMPRALLSRTRVRVHLGAAEALARVVLLEGEALEPGDSALAQLRLETPLVAARGDRFVLRSYSPMRTLGGGSVLEPQAEKRKRGVVEGLEVEDADERVLLALRKSGMTRWPAELARMRSRSPPWTRRRCLASGEGDRAPRRPPALARRPRHRHAIASATSAPSTRRPTAALGTRALRAQGARRALCRGPRVELRSRRCSRKA